MTIGQEISKIIVVKIFTVIILEVIMRNENTVRKYFGPKETEVIARLSYEKATIVTAGQFDEYFGFSPTERTQIIFRLKKKGIFSTIV